MIQAGSAARTTRPCGKVGCLRALEQLATESHLTIAILLAREARGYRSGMVSGLTGQVLTTGLLYWTRPSATNDYKRAADAVGQGTATAAYGVT